MFRIYKKTVISKVTALICITGVLLSCQLQTFAEQQRTDSPMSLEGFINEVLKVNPSVKLLDDKIAVQERRCNLANSTSEAAKTKAWLSDSEHMAVKKEELLYPMQAKNQLDELKWQRQNKVAALRTEASKLLYNYNFKLKEIDIQLKLIDNAKKDFEIAKKKVEVGKLSSLSLAQNESAISTAQQQLDSLNTEKTGITMKINSLLQRDLTQPILLQDEQLKVEEYTISDLDALISKQKESGHSVIKLKNSYDETNTEYFIQSYSMMEKSDTYDQLADSKLELEYSIKNEKANIELKIRSDYNDLLNLNDSMQIAKLTYDLNTKLHSVSEIKYQKGLLNISDFLKTATDKESALISYNKAQLNYAIAVMNFKMNYIE